MFIGEIVYFDLEGVSFSHLEKEMENLRSKARYKTVTCNTYHVLLSKFSVASSGGSFV
jgi:hypothetical protein